MAIPAGVKVELALTTTPDDPAPAWTDITQYVDAEVGIVITKGRLNEFGKVQPGTCTMTLDNTDGRFTADYASGAYYPNIKLRKKIRVSSVAPATASYRFTGYVDRWPVEWPGGQRYSQAPIIAVDRFKRLSDDLLTFRSVIEEEYLLDDPAMYYTLGEPSGSITAGDTSLVGAAVAAEVQQGAGGTLEFGGSTGPGTDGMTAPKFTQASATDGLYLQAIFPAPIADSACTLECFFNTTQPNVTLVSVQDGSNPASPAHTQIIVSAGKLRGYHPNAAITSAASVNDGLTHHAALVYDGSTGITLYLDGVSVGTSASGAVSGTARDRLCIGGFPDSTSTEDVFDGALAHVAYYATALSAARVLAHATAGLTGFSGERSDQRIARFASYAGIPTAEQSLEVGLSTSIAAYDTTGKGPLAAMQDIETTESGVLFMNGQGLLAFQARSHRYNAAIALTISGQDIDPSAMFAKDGQLLLNDVTASRPTGITYRATDEASKTENGVAAQSLTLYVTTDNEVIDAANWTAHIRSTPLPRISNLAVDILTNTAIAAAMLGLEIGAKITLNTLPSQAPAASVDLFVEGWTETITSQGWRFALNASPADQSTVWQLDSSVYSVLGVSTRLGY